MSELRRRMLMAIASQKEEPSDKLVLDTPSATCVYVYGTDINFGGSISYTSGKKYHYTFDWEVTAKSNPSGQIAVYEGGANSRLILTTQDVGITGHVDSIVMATSSTTKQALRGAGNYNNRTNYTLVVTNLKVYELAE